MWPTLFFFFEKPTRLKHENLNMSQARNISVREIVCPFYVSQVYVFAALLSEMEIMQVWKQMILTQNKRRVKFLVKSLYTFCFVVL